MGRINRRILLDEARDKLLSKCGLEYDPFTDRLDVLVSMGSKSSVERARVQGSIDCGTPESDLQTFDD
ncbi:hypothetical protein H0H92_008135 [Tricholoma furcatifolium]|nr:hypothetical protein H0H92_008135 [Tricholoma furcatifolium]